MRDFSTWLREHVVAPLNEAGVQIDLRGVQIALVCLPVALVLLGFVRAWWRKQQELKELQ